MIDASSSRCSEAKQFPAKVLCSTDLANAFGRLRRSRALERIRRTVPGIYRVLAVQWQNEEGVVVWQRSTHGWRQDMSATGGWQGSRLTQVAFAVDHAQNMQEWMLETTLPNEAPPQVVAVADDTYIVEEAGRLADRWAALEAKLAESGHRLRRKKCSAWFPAEETRELEEEPIRRLTAIVPRVHGGLKLLGAAAQGANQTQLGALGITAAPARERLQEAKRFADRIGSMAESACHPRVVQAAWSLLRGSCARALDYDLCVPTCGATIQLE